MKRFFTKSALLAMLFSSVLYFSVSVFAKQYGTSESGVRNTERWHQLSYFGEAWTKKPGQSAWIAYYRKGVQIKWIGVHKDSWRRDKEKLYSSGTVWDSLNPKAAKTEFRYSY